MLVIPGKLQWAGKFNCHSCLFVDNSVVNSVVIQGHSVAFAGYKSHSDESMVDIYTPDKRERVA